MLLSVWKRIDPTITAYALKRAALLIQVAGGEITSDLSDLSKKIEDFSVF
jgi:phenylalanyl-tRNA synthetase beta chain